MSEEIVQAANRDHLDWYRKGSLYQIFPDRFSRMGEVSDRDLEAWGSKPSRENFFGGNLAGISSKLPYLDRIGVANIYINPIFSAPSNHRYDTQNYFQIDPLLGDENQLASLVTQASTLGMGLLLDGVFNHVGDQFHNFIRALAGDLSERRLFNFVGDSNSYQTCGGASFLPKLNHESREVLDLISQVMSYWDAFGIKGWRLDVPWKVPHAFWQDLRQRTKDLSSSELWLAEAWQQWGFAEEFESVTNYFARTRLIDFVSRHDADAEDLVVDIEQWCEIREDPSLITNFTGSHDTARLLNECNGSIRDAQTVLIMNQFLPGVPALYYGDEIGLPGANDPDCRGTFPSALSDEQAKFLAVVEPIFGLRRRHNALSHGNFSIVESRNRTLIFERRFEDCAFTVVVNSGERAQLVSTALPTNLRSVIGEQVNGNSVPSHSLLIAGGMDCSCHKL